MQQYSRDGKLENSFKLILEIPRCSTRATRDKVFLLVARCELLEASRMIEVPKQSQNSKSSYFLILFFEKHVTNTSHYCEI